MIMRTEEQTFDFMAAAEETGKQLDDMVKRIPVELKAVLAEEWRKSPWLAELPKAAADARAATEKAEAATAFLNRSVRFAGFIVCLASIIIPLATWGAAYWNTSRLRQEAAELENAKHSLTATVANLKTETGGGVELVTYSDGTHGAILPTGSAFQREAKTGDGRNVLLYK